MSALEVRVPDIGDFRDVPVIEVLVKSGDAVRAEDPLVTLESDKATMDVPAPSAGVVAAVGVKVGDRVSEGSLILTLDAAPASRTPPASEPAEASGVATHAPPAPPPRAADRAGAPARPVPGEAATATPAAMAAAPAATPAEPGFAAAHASPSVRAFARELGVDLSKVAGTGPKRRILREDVQQFVKQAMASGASPTARPAGALDLLPWPSVDFAKFGPVDVSPLARIRKISGANLARNWVMIPHVTQFDEADVTDLEAFRTRLNAEQRTSGVRVTLLAFLVAASVAALKKFPDFNASIDGENLVRKRYYHVGFAADTPHGLVVPVIRDADRKGVLEIAREMSALSARAREGKLAPADMQGGCFSISSLGGIGGTAFTPIINAPEVAILGVSKSATKPVWDGAAFAPRLMLPLALSYDHRVIDGAAAARFAAYLAALLSDLRRAVL